MSISISYSAVVLDESSHKSLVSRLVDKIPTDWEVVAHHMTITMGPLRHRKGKYDMSQQYPMGQTVSLKVVRVGIDDRVIAVGIQLPEGYATRNRFPHITVAVNREAGGKPFHANQIAADRFAVLEPFFVTGTVQEIPQKAKPTIPK